MKELEDLYRTANAHVTAYARSRAASAYCRSSTSSFARRRYARRALDVGCGDGWSSALLSEQGFSTTGVDLHSDDFARHARATGSAWQHLELPFRRHGSTLWSRIRCSSMPRARTRLARDGARSPGGLCVVSPNLLSPLASLRGLTRYVWQNRPYRDLLQRPKDARHPFGNTFSEPAFSLAQNSVRILKNSPVPSAIYDAGTRRFRPSTQTTTQPTCTAPSIS